MGHKFLKKPKKILKKALLKKAAKKFAPELRELLILQFLHKKPSHGYEIIKHFQKEAPPSIESKANRVYPSLEKMKQRGYLKQAIDKSLSAKKPRKIYSLTNDGRKHLIKEINDLRATLDSIEDYVKLLEKEIK